MPLPGCRPALREEAVARCQLGRELFPRLFCLECWEGSWHLVTWHSAVREKVREVFEAQLLKWGSCRNVGSELLCFVFFSWLVLNRLTCSPLEWVVQKQVCLPMVLAGD